MRKLTQIKIGLPDDLLAGIDDRMRGTPCRTRSVFIREIVIQALAADETDTAVRIGRAGHCLNTLLRLAEEPGAIVSKAQVRALCAQFQKELVGLVPMGACE